MISAVSSKYGIAPGVVDARPVDERVARDRDRHARAAGRSWPACDVAADPAHDHHAGRHHQDPRPPGRPTGGCPSTSAPMHEHEHRAPCRARPGRRSTAARARRPRPAARCTSARAGPRRRCTGSPPARRPRRSAPPAGTARPRRSARRRSRPACRGRGRSAGSTSRGGPPPRARGRAPLPARYAGSSRSVAARLRSIAAGDQFSLRVRPGQPVVDLVVVLRAGGMAGLAAAEHQQASRRGRRGSPRTAMPGPTRLRAGDGVGDRVRRRPDGVGLAGQRDAGRAGRCARSPGSAASGWSSDEHVDLAPRPALGIGAEPPLELDAGARQALADHAAPGPAVAEEPVVARSSASSVPGTVRPKNSSSGDSSEKPSAPRNRSSSAPVSAYASSVRCRSSVAAMAAPADVGGHLAVPAREQAERAAARRRRVASWSRDQVAQARQRQRVDVGLDARQVGGRVPGALPRAGRRSAAPGTGSATRSRSGAGSRRARSGCWPSRSSPSSGLRHAGSSSYGTVPSHGSVVGNRPSPAARRGTGPPHIWYPIVAGQGRVDAVQRRAADAGQRRHDVVGRARSRRERGTRRTLCAGASAVHCSASVRDSPAASGVTTGPCAVVTTSCSHGRRRPRTRDLLGAPLLGAVERHLEQVLRVGLDVREPPGGVRRLADHDAGRAGRASARRSARRPTAMSAAYQVQGAASSRCGSLASSGAPGRGAVGREHPAVRAGALGAARAGLGGERGLRTASAAPPGSDV